MSSPSSVPRSVSDVVLSRHSCRQFIPDKPVPDDLLKDLLTKASRAASDGNLQPWKVRVLRDEKRKTFSKNLRDKMEAGEPFISQYHNYPDQLSTGRVVFDDEKLTKLIEEERKGFRKKFPEYHGRRQDCGKQLYDAIHVKMSDKLGKMQQLAKNADFFDAPVGLIISIDRVYERPQWGNVGMFLATFALLCEEVGLGTCFQGFFGLWGSVIKRELLKEEFRGGGGEFDVDREIIWCGVAVGWPDKKAAINQYRTPRAGLGEWCRFVGEGSASSSESKADGVSSVSKNKEVERGIKAKL